jgi:hypothetical protein
VENFRKKPRLSPFHNHNVAPMSFFDAAASKATFLSDEGGDTFGLYGEAYVRQCYKDLLVEIEVESNAWLKQKCLVSRLVQLRGSAGIGKSAFLAYIIAIFRKCKMESFAVFHSAKTGKVAQNLSEVKCSVWVKDKQVMNSLLYGKGSTRSALEEHLPKLDYLFMDGCSTSFSLESFTGIVFVAAPPSVYTKNLEDGMRPGQSVMLIMPPWSLEEMTSLLKMLKENQDSMMMNFQHMNGIVRYMFDSATTAKEQVLKAVKMVNPKSIINMAATQATDNEAEKSMVHALVFWEPSKKENGEFNYRGDPRFELVSRYAESLVAKKLYEADQVELEKLRLSLAPMSGAESYAGALFEALAIRKILAGGNFSMDGLQGQKSRPIEIPMISNPVVLECNTLSNSIVPHGLVNKKAGDGSWVPTMLWLTTTNFPTFDAYYFDASGDVYALQTTIAEKHELKNNGAFQTQTYLEKIGTAKAPYKVVFVVPKGGRKTLTSKQAFKGNVLEGKKTLMKEADATEMMDGKFEQWLMKI